MPMDIEGALWAYAHKDEYPGMGRRAEAAIREAFEARDRAPNEVEIATRVMDALADQLETGRGTYRYLIYERMGMPRDSNVEAALHNAWVRLWRLVHRNKDANDTIADRARAELERLEAEHPVPLQQLANPAHALIVTLRRILGEEGST